MILIFSFSVEGLPEYLDKLFEDFTEEDAAIFCDLLDLLLAESNYKYYTMVDTIQKARLCYTLGQLFSSQGDTMGANKYCQTAFTNLVKGGIDLSLKKWMELVSIRMNEEDRPASSLVLLS